MDPFQLADSALISTLGESVIYASETDTYELEGVFTEEGETVLDGQLRTTQPELLVNQSDIPEKIKPDHGVTVKTVDYTIIEVMPSTSGAARLKLRKDR